jgi:hypothetical protein
MAILILYVGNIQGNWVKRNQGAAAMRTLSAKKSRDDLSPRSQPEELEE